MPKKLKRKNAEGFNLTEMQNAQLELLRNKEQQKQLKIREEELKNRVGTYMEKVLKPSSNGHYLFTTISETGEKIHLQRQARKKISLDTDKAMKYLKKKKKFAHIIQERQVVAPEVTQDQVLDVLVRYAHEYVDDEEYVDEKALKDAVLSGDIPTEDFEDFCKVDISYAMVFVPDEKLEKEE